MSSDLFGKWSLHKNENWEEYMKAVGVGMVLRKIAATLTSHEDIKRDETGEWTLDITSTFKNINVRFKLDEEFEEKTIDGRHVKSKFEFVDGILRLTQKATKEGGVDSIITRQVEKDGTMLCTFEAVGKGVTCHKYFTRDTK